MKMLYALMNSVAEQHQPFGYMYCGETSISTVPPRGVLGS